MGIAFGKRFKEIRKNNNLTQKDLAVLCRTVPSSIVAWEKGTNYPSASLFTTLEKAMKVKISDLIALDSAQSGESETEPDPVKNPDFSSAKPTKVTMLPVVGMASAQHYDPALSQLCDLWEGEEDFVPCIIPGCDDCFALRICGDSMAPKLLDGDVVAVSDHLPRTGQTCIVMHRTDGILCKRWYWHNGVIRLESINPDGKNYEWTKEEFARENPFTWRFRVEGIVWRKEY